MFRYSFLVLRKFSSNAAINTKAKTQYSFLRSNFLIYQQRKTFLSTKIPVPQENETKTIEKQGALAKVKDVLSHYYNGSKLLIYEVRISMKLLRKILQGHKLIRREYRQLLRTSSDIFRLVPFFIILAIPFLELALPLIIKFFPNVLPSTFENVPQKEEKVKKQLKIKIEMAKFLQDMAEKMSINSQNTPKIQEMKSLFAKANTNETILSAEEVVRACSGLNDEITLENLSRPQLIMLCRFMSINALGTDNFLRHQIRKAFAILKRDDKMISEEGISSLSKEELNSACLARGIDLRGDDAKMRKELEQWITIQIKHSISPVLLILSRAFSLTPTYSSGTFEDALRETFSTLPKTLLNEAVSSDEKEEKIRLITEQEELISSELSQDQVASVKSTKNHHHRSSNSDINKKDDDLGVEAEEEAEAEEEVLSHSELDAISDAVVTLATDKPTKIERDELEQLIRDKYELQRKLNPTKDRTALMIEEQVEKLITKIDAQLSEFEDEIGKRLQIIESAQDGSITEDQLATLIQMIRDSPTDYKRLKKAIALFDADGDGKIFIKDILEIANRSEASEGHGTVDLKERKK